MNNYEKIYWLTRLDSINNLACTLLIISIVMLAIWYFVRLVFINIEVDDEDQKNKIDKKMKWPVRWAWTILIVFSLMATFLPTKNEMIIIYAGGATMNYIQKDTSLSKIPYQTTSIISEYLDKQLTELKGSHEKK